MKKRTSLAFLIALFAAWPAFAGDDDDLINADRPGIADSSAAVGRGRFQVETGVDRTSEDRAFPTLLRYGVAKGFELRVESENALTHPLLGFKWQFADAPSLGVIARAGRHGEGDVRLAADFNLGEQWSINPNVGVDRDKNALAALTIQYNLSPRANVFVDGGYDGRVLLVDAGAAVIIGRNTQLDLSATRAAHGGSRPTMISAGISRRF